MFSFSVGIQLQMQYFLFWGFLVFFFLFFIFESLKHSIKSEIDILLNSEAAPNTKKKKEPKINVY